MRSSPALREIIEAEPCNRTKQVVVSCFFLSMWLVLKLSCLTIAFGITLVFLNVKFPDEGVGRRAASVAIFQLIFGASIIVVFLTDLISAVHTRVYNQSKKVKLASFAGRRLIANALFCLVAPIVFPLSYLLYTYVKSGVSLETSQLVILFSIIQAALFFALLLIMQQFLRLLQKKPNRAHGETA